MTDEALGGNINMYICMGMYVYRVSNCRIRCYTGHDEDVSYLSKQEESPNS